MLTEARAELHAGDPRAALQTLERLRARSPKGVLAQEREVLTIQVLSALGDNAAAKRKAKEFLDAHPESPHTSQLRRLAADP
jgi:outer membrane protein assembly factor BamD (BamD/ComL family)